jgi:hypothetical protein
MRLEGLGKLKNPLTSSAIETATFLLVEFIIIVIIILSGVRLSPLGVAATTGLLYEARMIDDGDCGAVGGMKIGRGN